MLTLGTQRDLTNDMLIKGIIDSVVTVNQFYQMLPFKGIQGNALAYNRESDVDQSTNLVDVLRTGVTGINKNQQEFTRHSTELTTLIGDAQVNGLIQAVGSDYNDATAVQVAAKAKGIGRRYMDLLINGVENAGSLTDARALPSSGHVAFANGASPVLLTGFISAIETASSRGNNIDGHTFGTTRALRVAATGTVVIDNTVFTLPFTSGATDGAEIATAQGVLAYNASLRIVFGNLGFDGMHELARLGDNNITVDTETGVAHTLAYLDRMIDRVHDKDGMVDYLMTSSAGVRNITAAFRTAGTGFDMMDVKTSSGGVMSVQSYRGVPIFRNDFIQGNTGVSGTTSGLDGGDSSGGLTIYAGTLDDGSFTHGICGLTAMNSAGMQVQKLGAREDVDADITRVKWYCGLAHFSELGLVRGQLS